MIVDSMNDMMAVIMDCLLAEMMAVLMDCLLTEMIAVMMLESKSVMIIDSVDLMAD